MKIDDFYSTITRSNLSGVSLAAGSLKRETIEEVYGSPEEFLERYSSFQKRYINLLKTGQIDPSKIGRVNIDTLIAGGKIDLNILSEEAAEQMRRVYSTEVLRLPELFNRARTSKYKTHLFKRL